MFEKFRFSIQRRYIILGTGVHWGLCGVDIGCTHIVHDGILLPFSLSRSSLHASEGSNII